MTQQLSTLYPEKDVKGKAFLVKATGRALTAVKNRTLILDTLALIFNATQHSGMYMYRVCTVHPFKSKVDLIQP